MPNVYYLWTRGFSTLTERLVSSV